MDKGKTKEIAKTEAAEVAVTKPLTEEQVKLGLVFYDGLKRSRLLPRSKDSSFPQKPEDLGAILDVFKTDHYHVAMKALASTTIVRASSDPDKELNLALQQIEAIKPETYLQTMLAVQMIQVSEGINKCMGLAFMEGQTMQAREMNVNLATKLQRTFTAQVDAMQKLRGKGGQKVTVKHVHVHEGGQAIVGNVNQGGKGGQNE